jgi:hypothetical protein
MKSLLSLAIAALVTYAAWNAANAWMTYFRFKDAIAEASQSGGKLTVDQLRDRVLALGMEYSVPVDEDALSVTRDDQTHHTVIDGRYRQPIAILPWYQYPYTFTWHVDTFVLTGLK